MLLTVLDSAKAVVGGASRAKSNIKCSCRG